MDEIEPGLAVAEHAARLLERGREQEVADNRRSVGEIELEAIVGARERVGTPRLDDIVTFSERARR